MAQTSFTNTATGLPPDQIPQHYANNNNVSLDQVSGFIGGNIGTHSGGLVQFTWSDVDNSAHLDNTDLRPYTTLFDLGGHDLRIGTTVNNTPTVQDPYNSTYAWGFPYISSLLAPTPAANPILAAGFGQSALGYTLYAWLDNKLYLEGGVYSTLSSWSLARIGNGYGIGTDSNGNVLDVTGSANNKPDSNEFIIEADLVPFGKDTSVWQPLMNLKVGAQYIAYTQFNGASSNYDGAGRNASNNNTFILFAWLIF